MLVSEERRTSRRAGNGLMADDGSRGDNAARKGGARLPRARRVENRLAVWDPVGEHEAAQILGVSQQRVDQWERERSAGKREDFPAPVKRLAGTPLWDRFDIEDFGRVRRKRAGPVPGATSRRPRALAGVSGDELAAVLREREGAGLSERELEVLRLRVGMAGKRSGKPDRKPDGQSLGQPLGQQAVADALNVTLPAVKKAQQRAVEKVLAALGVGGQETR